MSNSPCLITSMLTEIADVERAKKNQIYPKNTIYIQVSACKRNTEDAWMILDKESLLDGKYAVITPRINIIPKYLKYSLESSSEEWHERYIGSNINISMNDFKYLKVRYTENIEHQKKVVEMFEETEFLIEQEQKIIEDYKQVKEWYLDGMFPQTKR